jgi:hypothetical protein
VIVLEAPDEDAAAAPDEVDGDGAIGADQGRNAGGCGSPGPMRVGNSGLGTGCAWTQTHSTATASSARSTMPEHSKRCHRIVSCFARATIIASASSTPQLWKASLSSLVITMRSDRKGHLLPWKELGDDSAPCFPKSVVRLGLVPPRVDSISIVSAWHHRQRSDPRPDVDNRPFSQVILCR